MRLFTGPELPKLDRSVIALGTFDGCHNGHRRVLRRAIADAHRLGCPCVVWTYREHPLSLIAPERAPLRLQSVEQRLDALRSIGVDAVCLRPFTREEASIEPEKFIRRLAGPLGMRAIVLGRSNTFGKGARGTPVLLEREGRRLGFVVDVLDTVKIGSDKVTSSSIREHLHNGEMRAATAMLGRCYAIEGIVITGRRLGRKMGFPTINLSLDGGQLLPRHGVYAGFADIGSKSYPCVLNVGVRPTVYGNALSLEAHLLDYEGDLYGRRASIRFFTFLRPERKFDSVDKLYEAIRLDQQRARIILK